MEKKYNRFFLVERKRKRAGAKFRRGGGGGGKFSRVTLPRRWLERTGCVEHEKYRRKIVVEREMGRERLAFRRPLNHAVKIYRVYVSYTVVTRSLKKGTNRASDVY